MTILGWLNLFIISTYWLIYFCKYGFFFILLLPNTLTAKSMPVLSELLFYFTIFSEDYFTKGSFTYWFYWVVSNFIKYFSNVLKSFSFSLCFILHRLSLFYYLLYWLYYELFLILTINANHYGININKILILANIIPNLNVNIKMFASFRRNKNNYIQSLTINI